MNTHKYLRRLGACKEAQYWALKYDTLEEAWAACLRGDWMLWLWGRYCGGPMDDRRRPLVLAAAECARFALPTFEHHRPNDLRPRKALNIAEKWGRGEAVTQQEITDAATDARDAADDAIAASCADAVYAAQAAYDAAYTSAAASAAYPSAASAAAAYPSAAALAAAISSASFSSSLAQFANIVRRHMPTPSFVQETP
jgi:hypothetical protein